MPQRKDITGNRYGKLVVVKYLGSSDKRVSIYECKCDCGIVCIKKRDSLSSGSSNSCGCIRKEMAAKWVIDRFKTHGLSKHPLFNVWRGMIDRCFNHNAKSFHNYGGRGIFVCEEWKKCFKLFYDWSINNGWSEGLDIDRVDNEKGYYPLNCRFITRHENTRNMRKNIIIEFNGESMCLTDWANKIGISHSALKVRIFKNKWPLEKALLTKKMSQYDHS